jgi:hypothetical protein
MENDFKGNVSYLRNEFREAMSHKNPQKGGGDHGGGGGGGSDLDTRIATLEKASQDVREKLVRVEMRLDAIETNMATKVDLANLASKDDLNSFVRASGKDIQDLAVSFHKSMNEQTWKFIGVAGVLAGLAFTAAKFIH